MEFYSLFKKKESLQYVGWICAKCHCGFVLRDTVTERQILPGSMYIQSFPGGSKSKASAYNEGDLGSIPGSGRSL